MFVRRPFVQEMTKFYTYWPYSVNKDQYYVQYNFPRHLSPHFVSKVREKVLNIAYKKIKKRKKQININLIIIDINQLTLIENNDFNRY